MHYTDRVFGEFEINEPVALELMKTPSLTRLKGVNQAGFYKPFFPYTAAWRNSRFDHSMGVLCVLRRFNAPFEEQIAGLLHDVSHSVFSHTIDYVVDKKTEHDQSHQDNVFEEFIMHTEIPEVLKKHGLDPTYIFDDTHFPLKETNLPDLCADRIDYSLRDALYFNMLPTHQIDNLIKKLTVKHNQWVFADSESARAFADFFLELNNKKYCDIYSALMFRTTGDYLRYALEHHYITYEDLYSTDDAVLAKIAPHHHTDMRLALLWERMNNRVPYTNDPVDYDTHIVCKSRVVDPLCMHNGAFMRVSEIDPAWGETLIRESKPKEYFIKFER